MNNDKTNQCKTERTCLPCGRKTCDRQPEDYDPADCKDWKPKVINIEYNIKNDKAEKICLPARDDIVAILDDHLTVTDEWGGCKLASWQWGNNVVVDGIDDAADAIMDLFAKKKE